MKKIGGGVDMQGIYAEYQCEVGHRIRIHSGYMNEIYFSGYNNSPDEIDIECDECNC